jgi:homoserine acetyltransferase
MHGSSGGGKAFAENIVSICSAQTSFCNITFLVALVTALTSSIDYADGSYRSKGLVPKEGLKAFGMNWAAWLTSSK